jgi:hypothetical protein
MGKTAFDLMHVPGYDVPEGHNHWGYTNGGDPVRTGFKVGGRVALEKGKSADKNWIQKAVNPKHKGFCTPMTKKTCTPKRKALAMTFKKMGRARKGKA